MRRLNRLSRDEKGAVLVLIVFFTVVMVAMAALVVDVGALLDERRQLQNGADAGALAVAHSCALGTCDAALAAPLANANSRDNDSAVDSVTYPAANQVRVATSTRGGGTNILPYSFGQAVTGSDGKTVHAVATARWGPVGRATAIRLAISQCDVSRLGISSVVSIIMFHSSTSICDGNSGHDTSGAFGWLQPDGSGNECELTVSVGMTALADTGTSGAVSCLAPYVGQEILLPVFDDVVGVTGSGANARYEIEGFARFHLTAYRFAGKKSVPPPPCTGSVDCISGYFVRYLTTSQVLGGTDFGVSTVNLVS